MGEKMRGMLKRSSSKMSVSKGSMNHIGTTPYRFKINVFISYVDNIKNADNVCVCLERRGKLEATTAMQVKDEKVIFKETLSIESTLFRKGGVKKKTNDTGSTANEELKFDEKKAKIYLRKDGPSGKSVGKLSLNLAEYVKGVTSTVFADIKLSNGSVIATKIEATMLQAGKKALIGSSCAGSDACSDMTDMNSFENDSIFGDDDDFADLESLETPRPSNEVNGPSVHLTSSPLSGPRSSGSTKSSKEAKNEVSKENSGDLPPNPCVQTNTDGDLCRISSMKSTSGNRKTTQPDVKQSASLRNKLKSKIKEKKPPRKEKLEEGNDSLKKRSKSAFEKPLKERQKSTTTQTEINELRSTIESLQKENQKLRESRQAAFDEMDALRKELERSQEKVRKNSATDLMDVKSLKFTEALREKDETITKLKNQNDNLIEELEEQHEEGIRNPDFDAEVLIDSLQRKIVELETALAREPQYLAVVDELKVTKVSLALASMEKEQALFALQIAQQKYGFAEREE